jgi:hypothetical protein
MLQNCALPGSVADLAILSQIASTAGKLGAAGWLSPRNCFWIFEWFMMP